MKINFNFDSDQRSFNLTPEDDLEKCLLLEMADRANKGSTVRIAQIETNEAGFRVEVKVNGK